MVLSRGAITVLANAPAAEPADKEAKIRRENSLWNVRKGIVVKFMNSSMSEVNTIGQNMTGF